jgi:sphingosine kinase
MATTSPQADDPFVDPSSEAEDIGTDHAFAVNSTLVVGRNASLTLGTDSLIVLGEQHSISSCASY